MPRGHHTIGGYTGTVGTYTAGGRFDMRDALSLSRSFLWGNGFTQTGLILNVDASKTTSYPGSGSTWTDLSSSANNLTITGATYGSTGGGSFLFSSTSTYLYRATLTNTPSSNMTLCAWVNFTSSAAGQKLVMHSRSATDSDSEFSWEINSMKQTFWDYNLGYGFNTVSANTTFSTGIWYHIAFVKNGVNGTFYLNGISDGTATAAADKTYGTNDFAVGKDYRDNVLPFTGYLGELQIYNTSLTSTQIGNNFSYTRSRYGV